FAARRFDADALAVLTVGEEVAAWVAGPGVRWDETRTRGARLSSLREAATALAGHLRAECALEHVPPERGRAAQELRLAVRGRPCVGRVGVTYRVAPVRAWTSTTVAGAGDLAIVVPARALPSSDRPYVLDYYLWGETARGS